MNIKASFAAIIFMSTFIGGVFFVLQQSKPQEYQSDQHCTLGPVKMFKDGWCAYKQ